MAEVCCSASVLMDTMAPGVEWLEGSFTWKIDQFSKLSDEEKLSETFEIGGYEWCLSMYPKRYKANKGHLSLFLEVADADALPEGLTRTASYTMIVHHKSDPEKSVTSLTDCNRLFNAEDTSWGCFKLIKLEELNDAQKGFLVEDTLTVEVQVKVKPDLLQAFTENDEGWSLCLQFDALMTEPESAMAKADHNQKKRVKLDQDAKQQMRLYLDVGFMSIHSKLVKNMIEDMNLSAPNQSDKCFKIVIPVPKEFCPGRCSLADVQRALGHLYLPQEFPLQQCNISMHKLLQVADYFQMRYLTLDIESYLLSNIQEKLKTNSTDVNQFMEWMLWSDSFDLKECWSALKEGLLRKKAALKSILKYKDFKKLSQSSQIEFMESVLLSLESSGRF